MLAMRVVVIGASLAGLLAAAASAQSGARTMIIERDLLPAAPEARKGVPQSRQAHILLHRGLRSAEALLPGLRDDLIAAGASAFDSGEMPWLGEYGWMPTWLPSYELVSATRPVLEHVVRRRVQAFPLIEIRDGVRVTGLRRNGVGWQVITEDGATTDADLVIDASGRGSRMPHWLAELGVRLPDAELIDPQLGYACRLYRAVGPAPLRTGVVIATTPATGRGGMALPVENDHWLVLAIGCGPQRPTRDPGEFAAFLTSLHDPGVADVAAELEPVGDIAVYRQTSNRRNHYGKVRNWPDGLLAVGDSACAFDPVYGQGITIAAQQAVLLRDHWGQRRLQRRLDQVADFCWSVATTEDLRYPTADGRQNPIQRLVNAWTTELTKLAVAGHRRSLAALAGAYHLMIDPRALFHPALFVAVGRARIRGRGQPAPRPAALERLDQPQRT